MKGARLTPIRRRKPPGSRPRKTPGSMALGGASGRSGRSGKTPKWKGSPGGSLTLRRVRDHDPALTIRVLGGKALLARDEARIREKTEKARKKKKNEVRAGVFKRTLGKKLRF